MPQLLCNSAFNPLSLPLEPSVAIEKIIQFDSTQDFILIVPTGRQVRYLKKLLIKNYFQKYAKPVPEPLFFTLQGFALYLFSKLFNQNKYRIITEAYRFTLLEEASE